MAGMHEILRDGGDQTLTHVPPSRVASATYSIEDLTLDIDAASRVLGSGSATVDSLSETTTAASGVGQTDPRRIAITNSAAVVGRQYEIVSTDGTTERLRVEAVTSTVMAGSFNTTLAVGKRWIDEGLPGSVLSNLTTWVWSGSAFVVPSAMAKAAVHAMTMSLAVEWGRYGIRLNTIAPGEIPTEGMSKRIKPGDEAGARTIAMNPMGRVGRMEELQNLATFLISGGCDWINGETIAMDGAQALAMGGNFYQLRDWKDSDWSAARDAIMAQNEKDKAKRA